MKEDVSILIVDDSKAIRGVLTELLTDFDVKKVDSCGDGESALQKISSDPTAYDAIFVDLHMEGMDGLELMHQLHNIRYPGGVVVMSALDTKILEFTLEVISAYNLRVLGSIEKPFEKSLIAFMIKRIRSFVPPYSFADKKLMRRREVMEAIQERRVMCYFQPKISLAENKVIGVECLARLQSRDGATLSPISFLPVVERFNLMGVFTDAIFDIAIPKFLEFQDCINNACSLSVNISPRQLYNDALPDTLNEYMARYQFDRSQLLLEITENYALRDDVQLKNLNRLSIHGFNLSLDDYGAGYTNLRQLKNIPFKEIKIDAQMVEGISRDRVLQVIVESVRNVTNELNLKLIAEGVEYIEDMDTLKKINVDAYQGYLLCRPKPVDELIRWFHSWQNVKQKKAG